METPFGKSSSKPCVENNLINSQKASSYHLFRFMPNKSFQFVTLLLCQFGRFDFTSQNTPPSDVLATFVKIVFRWIVSMAMGFVLLLVPKITTSFNLKSSVG
jgi:hypothetical protein